MINSSQKGWIYVLDNQLGHYKIGKASVLDRRIKQLKIQLPFPVTIWLAFSTQDCHRAEAKMHASLDAYRINGEWFEIPTESVGVIFSAAVESGMELHFSLREYKGEVLPFSLAHYAQMQERGRDSRRFVFNWFADLCVFDAMSSLPFTSYDQASNYLTPNL